MQVIKIYLENIRITIQKLKIFLKISNNYQTTFGKIK